MNTESDFGTKFRTTCPSCEKTLNGYLIRQRLLNPAEIHHMVRGRASERTIRRWMREWCPSGALPGRRAPVVEAREFVLALEAHRLPYGATRVVSRLRKPSLQTKCSNCGAVLGGFVARLAFRDLRDVIPEIGAGIFADAILGWIRRGLLRAFRLRGIRGPLFDEGEFEQDFTVVRDKYLRLRSLASAAATTRPVDGT